MEKQYFIAYAMDKGERKQLLLYQFEFKDKSKDPFSLPQPVIIDRKPAGEDSVIGILTKKFNSSRIGIHLIHTNQKLTAGQPTESHVALREHFFRLCSKW